MAQDEQPQDEQQRTEQAGPVIEVSDEAREMILSLREQEPGEEEYGLLIEITGIQGPQFKYELSFIPVGDAGPQHLVERHGDLPLIVPEEDVEKLRGSSLALTEQGLAMNNPNRPASPAMGAPQGDLSGPMAERVQQVLTHQVNPAIAAHGGAAELVSVDDEDVAYLRLQGGCVGCGMAQVTLRHGIERILREAIPELAGVVDVTDHATGDNPYYESAKK